MIINLRRQRPARLTMAHRISRSASFRAAPRIERLPLESKPLDLPNVGRSRIVSAVRMAVSRGENDEYRRGCEVVGHVDQDDSSL